MEGSVSDEKTAGFSDGRLPDDRADRLRRSGRKAADLCRRYVVTGRGIRIVPDHGGTLDENIQAIAETAGEGKIRAAVDVREN